MTPPPPTPLQPFLTTQWCVWNKRVVYLKHVVSTPRNRMLPLIVMVIFLGVTTIPAAATGLLLSVKRSCSGSSSHTVVAQMPFGPL